ncbi:MAG: VOC family protein [Aequorivita sp.]
METIEFILYVSDQARSTDFYGKLLELQPTLNVPGMTEFNLSENVKLGLMPESGIAKIISPAMPHPERGNGIPRCEIYLKIKDPETYLERALTLGGKIISPLYARNWGDTVGYLTDLDGHVIAFAKTTVH